MKNKDRRIDVLGTKYDITFKNYNDDDTFEKGGAMGYCNTQSKVIVVCNMNTYPGYENELESTLMPLMKECIRHEIVHAFFSESGLNSSSLSYNDAWANNEEMVDWIAYQGVKMYNAWKQADAI